ncbi:MAG: septum formation initiator family protein [Clostridia bacterium]|nr:septum formation initiator family protein [Clostridia bacterium]
MAARKRRTRLPLIIFLIVCVYFTTLCYKQHLRIQQTNVKAEEVKNRIEQVKKTNQELEKDVEFSKTDEYIEKIAREKLGLVKPGETIYIRKQKGESN